MSHKHQFQDLAAKLVKLGESQEEFDLWLAIFDDLPEARQRQLASLMLSELEELRKIK